MSYNKTVSNNYIKIRAKNQSLKSVKRKSKVKRKGNRNRTRSNLSSKQ